MRAICAVIPLALAVVGCGGSRQPTPSSLPAVYLNGESVIDDSPAFSFLPRETPFALAARSPRALDAALGWPEVASLFFGDHQVLADLDALTSAGIDVARPFGWAVLDLRTSTTALFASVADRAAVEAALRAAASRRGTPLDVTTAGSATIYLPAGDDAHAAVLRGDQVFLLASSGARSVRDLTAVKIATTDPSDSLAEDLSFQHAAGRLRFGRDLAGFAALDRIALALAAAGDPAAERIATAARAIRSRVDQARRAGASADDLVVLQRQEEWMTALQLANKSREQLLLGGIGALGAVAFGVELEPSAARIKIVAAPDPSSLPGALLPPGSEPTRLLDQSAAPPLFALALRGPRERVLELVNTWLGTRGVQAAQLAQRVDLDFDRDIAPILSGDIGVALTAAGWDRSDLAGMRAHMQVELALGLSDRDRMSRLLSELAARKDMKSNVDRTASAPRLVFPWPGFEPLHVGLTGDALLATTDGSRFQRAAGGTAQRPFVGALRNAALRELMSGPGAPFEVIIDGALLPGILAADEEPLRPRVALVESEPTPDSPEYQEVVERIARVDAEIAEMRTAQRAARLERSFALGRDLGTFALLVSGHDDGVVAIGGQFPDEAGLRAAFADLVGQKRRNDDSERAAKRALEELEQRRNALEKERSRIRSRDDASPGDAPGRMPPAREPSPPPG